jgi:benzoyl-CoA reductase subunit C
MNMSFETFPEWRGKELDEILYECRELLEDTEYPTINRWRQNGGKVAGHFQVYFPEEIAHAAGMLPVKMGGAPVEPNSADSHFGSYLCSIIKTSLEVALNEKVKLDLFISHPICDAARNLAAIFGRNFDYPCQILYLPQNPNSSHSLQYLTDEYGRLKRLVEEITGNKITDEKLRASIEVYNQNRQYLREIYDIKRDTPWLLTADEGYALLAIGGLIPREEHNEVLKTVIPLIKSRVRKKEDRIRLVFEGGFCEQPPLDLIRMLGQTCYLVDDDFLIGMRWILSDVSLEGEPLRNLAHSYLEDSSYSPVQHDNRKPKEEMLLKRIEACDAGAVIIAAAKMCEPGLEEQVAYTHELDRKGIPYFVTEFEENMNSFDHLEMQVDTFLENLLF